MMYKLRIYFTQEQILESNHAPFRQVALATMLGTLQVRILSVFYFHTLVTNVSISRLNAHHHRHCITVCYIHGHNKAVYLGNHSILPNDLRNKDNSNIKQHVGIDTNG